MSDADATNLRSYLLAMLEERKRVGANELVASAIEAPTFRGERTASEITWVIWDMVDRGEAVFDEESYLLVPQP